MASRPLPANFNPSFAADYPGAIVYPAHPSNYYRPDGHGGVPNRPRAWVLHTPEEPADDNESTPAYFSQPDRKASTLYYLDHDGDVYQLVPESCAAIANGLLGKPQPSWAAPGSLNWQTLNVEIEGRAASIHETMPVGGVQFQALVRLIRHRSGAWGIPLDRGHTMGHDQISIERTDPGRLFPWDALMAALAESEEAMIPKNALAPWWTDRQLGPTGPEPERWQLNAIVDFGLDPAALPKRIRLGVYLKGGGGYIRFFDGLTGDEAEPVGWGTQPIFGAVDVGLSADGLVPFRVEAGPVDVAVVRLLGYWP